MALVFKDRVYETSVTSGTGALTLAGAVSGGYQRFQDAMSINDTAYYAIEDVANNTWEVGLGTLTALTVLARTSVLASSNSGSAVNFSANAKNVYITVPASWLSGLGAAGISQLTGDVLAGPGSGSQAATLKVSVTIVTPTIASFTNATHTHQNAAGGGTLDAAAIATGVLANAQVNWASPSAIGGTAAAAGTFTSVVTPIVAPSADGTSAIKFTKADKSTVVGQFDTTNGQLALGIGTAAPAQLLDLYDGHLRFTQLAAPGAPTAALAGLGAGNVDNGAHLYKVTFVTAAGETQGGTASGSVTTTGGNGQVALSAIPTGATGTTARKIYRTKAGGTIYLLLTTLNDNTTTTYADNTADASLTTGIPSINSTGGGLYGGATKAFAVDQSGNLVLPNSLVQDWIGGGKKTALLVNALNLDNAYSATSLLLDLQFNGVSKFAIDYTGAFVTTGLQKLINLTVTGNNGTVTNGGWLNVSTNSTGNPILNLYNPSNVLVGSFAGTGAVTLSIVDANTASVQNTMTVTHALTTANAGANNIGAGLVFQAADSTSAIGAGVQVGAINATLPNSTHASRTGRVDITVTDNAATRTVISAGANGTAATFSLYNATPVIQPATTGTASGFTAGAGTAVKDDSTFTGGTGATAYRISDIVLALKQLGILAA